MYPRSLELRTIIRRTLEFTEALKAVEDHAFLKHQVSAILSVIF